MPNNPPYLILSHALSAQTPGYAGKSDFQCQPIQCLNAGDSCNKHKITMSNHVGTHVDAPSHFIKDGKSIADYGQDDWLFQGVKYLDCTDCLTSKTIDMAYLANSIKPCKHTTLLLMKTGMEDLRHLEEYWSSSVVFKADIGGFLIEKLPNLSAIGMDTISVSSMLDRAEGRHVHQALLSRNIRIIEDMKLSVLNDQISLTYVHVIPHIVDHIDGTPVTVLAGSSNDI